MNTFDLTLDLDKRFDNAPVRMRQGDKSGTTIRAAIYDHGELLSGNFTVRYVQAIVGHDHRYYRETGVLANGIATVTVDETYAAAVAGSTYGYFQILQGSAVIASTQSFAVHVLPDATYQAEVAPPYDSAIEDALAELDEATGRISQMVQDATAEYLEAHPELTTTVLDNSITDAKLIQKGGILQREQWLESLVPVLNGITKETPEADVHSVTDSAGGGPLGITVYGRSTQDGTPTPDAPVPIESVEGNLWNSPRSGSRTDSGITWTYNADGSVTAVGTATGNSWSHTGAVCDVTLPAGTYTASVSPLFGLVIYNVSTGSYIFNAANPTQTFTLADSATVRVFARANSGTSYNSTTGVMLVAGDIPYAVYVPHGSVGLHAVGKNFLPSLPSTITRNGVTFTRNPFGSITVNGTATALAAPSLLEGGILPAGTYTLRGCPSGGSDNTYRLDLYIYITSNPTTFVDYGNGVTFTLNKPAVVQYCRIRIPSGVTVNNLTFYPRLTLGSSAQEYTPYTETIIPIDLGGRSLRSLPDGTRDEVNVDEWGHARLIQRVGHIELDGSSDEDDWQALNKSFGVSAPNIKIAQTSAQVIQTRSNRFVPISSDATWMGSSVGVGIANTTNRPLRFCNGGDMTIAEWKAWLAANPVTVDYPLATPVTIDLGYLDPALLPAPDLTAYAVPSAPSVLRYGFDVAAALAELATA